MSSTPRDTSTPRFPELPLISHAGTLSPCEAYDCTACCHDTEMPLFPDDVERLHAATGLDPEAFSVPDPDGPLPRLRNADGRCVFHDGTGCTVYAHRPRGCRLYPLVFDADHGRTTLDPDCPHRQGFRVRPKDRAAVMALVARLQRMDDATGRTA